MTNWLFFAVVLKESQTGHRWESEPPKVAEIVHDMDLKDDKFHRSEAAGPNLVIRGLAGLLKDDRKLVGKSIPIFDGICEALSRGQEKSERGENGENRTQSPAVKRSRRATRN